MAAKRLHKWLKGLGFFKLKQAILKFWCPSDILYGSGLGKSRNLANKSRHGYVYRRPGGHTENGRPCKNYEPRYTPPDKRNRLPLGAYSTEDHAKVVLTFAQFQYNENALLVDLGHGFLYFKSEQERNFSGQDKWAWIAKKAKEVVDEYEAWRTHVDGAASREDVGATTRPEQVGAENLTGDIMANEFLNPFHDTPVDDTYRWADDMIVQGGTPPTEGRESEQPNLQNDQLEEEQQQQTREIQPSLEQPTFPRAENSDRQIQPSLEQPTFPRVENSDSQAKNNFLKDVYEQVRKLLGLPSLQPPLRSDGENFTQQPLEEQNSELSWENQRLRSILRFVIDEV